MNRRRAIAATGALVGGAMLLPAGFMTACDRSASRIPGRVLSHADQDLIEEIADTLLPTTAASPGAKAAHIGPDINLILSDCYAADAQERVITGLGEFRGLCRERFGRDFADLARDERESLLKLLDSESARGAEPAGSGEGGTRHYFETVRELVLGAYFASQVGRTRALRYVPVPGRWVGCVPLEPGQPAWD